jgi:hypothetical protein
VPGPQGPAGAVAGYITNGEDFLPPPTTGSHGGLVPVETIIAHLSPGSANDAIAINATVTGFSSFGPVTFQCYVQDTSPSRSSGSVVKSMTSKQGTTTAGSTTSAYTSANLDVAGFLYPRARSAGVSLVCADLTRSRSPLVHGVLTATGLSATTSDAPRGSTSIISNRFRDALKRHHAVTRSDGR